VSASLPGTATEPGGWTRVGSRRSGRVMRSLGFMRVERCAGGWRAWDAIQLPVVGHPYGQKILPTLAAAKAYAEACTKLAALGE
jgi:hypothetical protein